MFEALASALHHILHLDQFLESIVNDYGTLTYIILFCIIFCETGLVVTPILPGDSLLFAAGTLAAAGLLNISVLVLSLLLAAVLGNALNYAIGRYCGAYFVTGSGVRFVKQDYLAKTHHFYEKYGAKTIVITRFVPIARTIAPFVAGLGNMSYRVFMQYNLFGGALWVGVLLGGSYGFGNLPFVKAHFSTVILGVIILSVLPAVFEWLRAGYWAKTR